MKKIVYLNPTEKSKIDLYNLSSSLDLRTDIDFDGKECNNFEYHMTLFMSENEIEYPNFTYVLPKQIISVGILINQLGDQATALIFQNNTYISDLRKKIIFEMGVTPTFAEHLPHVSLSYVLNNDLKIPKSIYFPVTFESIKIKDTSL